ncbi:MAG TPA: hypothetical protein VK703_10520 [Candidatus Acidoferrales bacterium]|nr:hypothetical protein [Candidatus Acidoferrales bacterium]
MLREFLLQMAPKLESTLRHLVRRSQRQQSVGIDFLQQGFSCFAALATIFGKKKQGNSSVTIRQASSASSRRSPLPAPSVGST